MSDVPREQGDATWLRQYNRAKLGKRHQKVLDIRRQDGVLIVHVVAEELCHQEAPAQLREELTEALADAAVRRVVFALSSVQYVASTFVGTVLWLQQLLSARAGRICLSGVHWRVNELLKLCRVDGLVSSRPRIEEAMELVRED